MLHLESRSSETFESHWCPQSGFWDPNSQQGFQLPLSWTWNSRVINIRWVYQYYILCVWFFSPHACDLSYTYSNFLCVWVGVLKYPSMHTLGRPVDIISMISKWKIFILTPTNSISSRLKNFCIVFLLFIFWLCSASNKSNNEVVNRTFNMQSKRQSSQKYVFIQMRDPYYFDRKMLSLPVASNIARTEGKLKVFFLYAAFF